jgi:Fe2+ or Zn2+ uptake regulation protein
VSKKHAVELVNQLRRRGKRVTRERELLLRVIADNAHLDAEEIHRLARREHPQIGLATVYRTLNLLKELDLVTAVGLGEPHSHFELCAEDHIHLVCSTCGRVVDVPAPTAVRKVAEREGFCVHRVSAEISGTCRTCTSRQIKREKAGTT